MLLSEMILGEKSDQVLYNRCVAPQMLRVSWISCTVFAWTCLSGGKTPVFGIRTNPWNPWCRRWHFKEVIINVLNVVWCRWCGCTPLAARRVRAVHNLSGFRVWKYLLVQRKSNIIGRYVSYFGFSIIFIEMKLIFRQRPLLTIFR